MLLVGVGLPQRVKEHSVYYSRCFTGNRQSWRISCLHPGSFRTALFSAWQFQSDLGMGHLGPIFCIVLAQFFFYTL